MAFSTNQRNGDTVIDLLMGNHNSWTTTADYFTKNDFTALRDGIKKLQEMRGGGALLQKLEAGEERNAAEQKVLHDTLGKFDDNPNAVKAVKAWVSNHAQALPEDVLNIGGRPVFQDELRTAAKQLAAIEKRHHGTIAALSGTKAGALPALDKDAMNELISANLLNNGSMTSFAEALFAKDGAVYMTEAGLDVAKLAKPTATVSRFISSTATPLRETTPETRNLQSSNTSQPRPKAVGFAPGK